MRPRASGGYDVPFVDGNAMRVAIYERHAPAIVVNVLHRLLIICLGLTDIVKCNGDSFIVLYNIFKLPPLNYRRSPLIRPSRRHRSAAAVIDR